MLRCRGVPRWQPKTGRWPPGLAPDGRRGVSDRPYRRRTQEERLGSVCILLLVLGRPLQPITVFVALSVPLQGVGGGRNRLERDLQATNFNLRPATAHVMAVTPPVQRSRMLTLDYRGTSTTLLLTRPAAARETPALCQARL